jgi:periplasmic copper chaperone A
LILGLAAAIVPWPASALFIVNQPWVRPAQAAQSTEAYMNLTSTEGAKLIAVRSDAAKAVALRTPGKKPVVASSVTLPAKVLVELAPGQYRIALNQVLRTLKPGDRLNLTLTLELDDGSRQEIDVNAEVRLRSPIDDERRAHVHASPPAAH